MGRGGKVGGKGSFRKGAQSKEANSDDSDEDYVVSDEEYSSSFDGFVTEEEEEEERPRVRNFIRSKTKYGICGWGGNASRTSRKRGRIIHEEKEGGGEEEEEDKDGDEDEDEEEVLEEEEDEYEEEEDDYEEEDEEDEDKEIRGMRNFSSSKARNVVCGQHRNASKTSAKRRAYVEQLEEEEENGDNEKEVEEDEKDKEKEEEGYEEEEDEYEEEVQEEEEEEEQEVDEEEEIQEMRNFSRSKARDGVCSERKNPSKTSTKRRWITYAEQLEEDEEDEEDDNEKNKEVEEDEKDKGEEEDENDKEEEEEEYEEEKVETEDEWKEEEEGDGDEEDDEFTPEEDDSSDEEEEMRGRGKKNIGMTMGKKVLQKRSSVISLRGQKKPSSRASKRPLRNKRRKNGWTRRKLKCDDQDDFIDNGPTIRTTSREKRGRKRRRVLLSDSGCMSSGSPDVVYTISEEEREQVREATELCGGLRINLRSSSLLIKNKEDGVHEDLHQLRKPLGRQGKEKTEEPQERKGKEKVEDLKNEVAKQVCGICLSEENKRRVRGVLNCCTHYFCFACIMEWAKVESRCPLCKQRFTTISKPARSTTGIDLRDVVIQVPERDQVYQPSEEELRSYFDPYDQVICSECHQGGDDGLMLLCDICDSPAHTYCVGLGREVPEGNWYCDGCRPVALGSSSSEVQERVAEQTVTIQSLPVRLPAIHVRETIDLNLVSSPHVAFSHGFGHLSSSRFSGRSVEGASPVSGGAPTLSQRRWIHRQIQQLLSVDGMTSTTGRTNAIPATSSASNLYSSQIDHSRQIATEYAMTQDVGTSSYHTFFEETLCNNNTSPLIQNGALWPGLVGTTPILDFEQIHQFSRSNLVIDGSLSPGVREESNFHNAKEQLQSMVKSHLMSMSQNLDLGHNTFKDIARSCMHTILAACGLEPKKSEVFSVAPPAVCSHIDLNAAAQMSLIKGCCSSCFDSFVGDVVRRSLDTRISSQWLRLGL